MNLINWSPFGDFDTLLDRFARDVVHARGSYRDAAPDWRPATSIVERSDEYVISADLPAVKREDVTVTVDENVLTIKGERRFETQAEGETEHRRETWHGTFERRFSLPQDADADGISAESKDGVLTVRIPRIKPSKPEVRSITVN